MAKPTKGTTGDDLSLLGTNGKDKLQGKAGDDFITGLGGNDDIDGGQGIDTAFYTGVYDDYDIVFKGTGNNKISVTDEVAARDGADQLKHVELLQFADATVNIVNGTVWEYQVNAAVDPIAQHTPGQLFQGSGNSATDFGIARNDDAGVELGFKVIYRNGPNVLSSDTYADGVLEYTVNSGPQSPVNGSAGPVVPNRAAWNFTYSIATNTDGGGGDLNDFTFRLLIDVDPTDGTDYISFQLEPETLPGAGTGTAQSNFVWRSLDDPSVTVPVDDEGNANVTQNSRNFGFGEFQAFLAGVYGPGNAFAGDHEFDITLQALDDGQLIAQNHIRVNVDDPLVI